MTRTIIRAAALVAGSVVALAAPAASACANHGSADNYFLAYVDYTGMTETEQRAAEQQAIDQYHARQLQQARTQFVRRFQVDAVPEEAKAEADAAGSRMP